MSRASTPGRRRLERRYGRPLAFALTLFAWLEPGCSKPAGPKTDATAATTTSTPVHASLNPSSNPTNSTTVASPMGQPSGSQATASSAAPAKPETAPRDWDQYMEYGVTDKAPSPLCVALLDDQRAKLERALEKARRALAASPPNQPEPWLPQIGDLLEPMRCYSVGNGEAWFLGIANLKLNEDGGMTMGNSSADVSYELLYRNKSGRSLRVLLSDDEARSIRQEDPLLVDLDGRPGTDILWVAYVHPGVDSFAWAAKNAAIQRLSALPIPGVAASIERSRPGHGAFLRYHVSLSSEDGCYDEGVEVEHDTTYYSPTFAAEVVGGKLRFDTALAVNEAKQWCPAAPKHWHLAEGVLCARLWGASTSTLTEAVQSQFSQGSCADKTAASRPARGATIEYDAMLTAARWQPPFRLDKTEIPDSR